MYFYKEKSKWSLLLLTEKKFRHQLEQKLKKKQPKEDAAEKEVCTVGVKNAEGKICGEFVWAYPPGIPILIPGEKISPCAVQILTHENIHSDYGNLPEKVMIIKDLER